MLPLQGKKLAPNARLLAIFHLLQEEKKRLMRNYTHLIWDFNGTILNDVALGIESANYLLAAHGLPLIQSVEQYRELFGFPIQDYYLRMGFDFDKTPYSELAVEWVAYYLECKHRATVFEGIPSALARAQALGISQLILSATELEMLKGQVEELGLLSYFNELLGLGNIRAHSKKEIGLQWRAQNPQARVLMIGDTDHDAEVALAMGADCVLLCCGHQSRERLEKCNCLLVADSVEDAFHRLFQ